MSRLLFSSWCRLRRCSERLVEAPAGSVVARELGPVRLVAVPALVELGSALDLVLRPADVDLLVVTVDAIDHARRDHDLLAEDPRARVDDDVARANVVGRLVDLADRPVDRLDAEPSQILLVEELRQHVGGPDGEKMIWAFQQAVRIARVDEGLLDYVLAAVVCLIARVNDCSPRTVLELFF